MGRHYQNLNQPLDQEVAARNLTDGLNAAVIGAVSTSVLRFNLAAVITGATPAFIRATNDADLGTEVTILKSGLYSVKLYLQAAPGAFDVVYAVSQDVAVAGLTAEPTFAIAGFVDVQRTINTAVDAIVSSLELKTEIIVPHQAPGTGSMIRFHATGPAGISPLGDLVLATAYYTVERINQAHV